MPRINNIQIRRGTAAAWTSANPVLSAGEPGLETDTRKIKYGDGTTAWNSLAYSTSGGGHTIEEEGTPLTQRTKLNFVGAGVTVTDDSGNDATVVTIPAGGGGTGTVESVTGDGVDNTDPDNPVISFPTASDIGLGNVNNTSDANKPVSTAQQAALDLKANLTTVIGVQDLPISATAMWPRVTSGCSVLTQYEMATSLFNIQGLEFSSTVQQFCQCQTALPRKWNNGTVTAIIYWKPLASGSGDVRWGVQMGAYSNDDALTAALGTEVAVTDTFIATDDLHITSATAAITVAGSPADADFLAIQINRNPTNGSDTLDVNAVLLGITIRLTTDAAIDA